MSEIRKLCQLQSNMIYTVYLMLKIGRRAVSAEKISREWPYWANFGLCNAQFCYFEVPVMLPFSKVFGRLPLIVIFGCIPKFFY